ncbi:MAG: hypothetical protein QM493_08400, partial [Sulfurovum sp.]
MAMALDKYQKDEFWSKLQKNEDLDKIITAISYSDNSDVEIIVSSNPLLSKLTIEYIDQILTSTDEKREVVYLIQEFKESQMVLDELQKFLFNYQNSGKKKLFILDLSSFASLHRLDIEKLFSKLNELRNIILDTLNSPILLILPQQYTQNFMFIAPDFWSLKKFTATIDESLINQFGSGALAPPYDEAKAIVSDELNSLIEDSIKLKKSKQTDSNLRLLMIKYAELGDYSQENGDWDNALKYYKLSESISNKRADSIEAKRDVSVSLEKIANIYLQKGEV